MTDVKETGGRLLFAVADQDGAAMLQALREFPRERNFELILCLAETAADALRTLHGDGWQDALNMAMLAASVEEVDGGSAEHG